jgi:hypothetical protein
MKRSTFVHSLRVVGMVAGAGLAAQACAFETKAPTGTGMSSSMLGGDDNGYPTAKGGGSIPEGTTYIYVYIFERRFTEDRHHPIGLAASSSETFTFTWHDAAGAAPAADLWIESEGRKVLQVAAVDGHPFLRSGLDVTPIDADQTYRVVFSREGDSLGLTVLGSADEVVLRTQTAAAAADVVLPAPFWRASVNTDLK